MATITGDENTDFPEGTPDPDQIDGLGGNATLEGIGDPDLITADAGNDDICGGDGGDTVRPNEGDDRVQSSTITLSMATYSHVAQLRLCGCMDLTGAGGGADFLFADDGKGGNGRSGGLWGAGRGCKRFPDGCR